MTDPTPEQVESALEVLEEALHEGHTAPAAEEAPASAKPKYLDLGPQYLGPVAINGT